MTFLRGLSIPLRDLCVEAFPSSDTATDIFVTERPVFAYHATGAGCTCSPQQ